MDTKLTELLEKLKKPISDDAPCGENARHDPRYDEVKTEIMKMTAGPVGIEWTKLRGNLEALLEEKTKDLTLAAYLCLSLLKENGFPGLLVGLQLVDFFVDTWWETMFPPVKRKKARIQIFEWMNERLSALGGVVEPSPEDREVLQQCLDLTGTLPDKVQGLVKAPITGFSGLRAEMSKCLEQIPEPEPEPEPEPKSEPESESPEELQESESTSTSLSQNVTPMPEKSDTSGVATSARPPKKAPINLNLTTPEELESLDEGLQAILKIVSQLREVEPNASIVYRLDRVLTWETVTSGPPAGPDGKTQIPPPDREMLLVLETQLQAGNWEALIQTAENRFVNQSLFYLDLQYYVFQGLSNQGADSAAEVVLLETGRLLNRFPELLGLSFSNGMPFANDETQQWAADAMKAAAGSGGTADEEDDNAWLKEATKVASKSMAAALPLFQDAINEAENVKSIMKRQCDVAKFFINNREYHWALPLLESLHDKIETVGLAQWDPSFCSDVWSLMLKGYEALPLGPETTGKDNAHKIRIRQLLFEANVAKAAAATPKEKQE